MLDAHRPVGDEPIQHLPVDGLGRTDTADPASGGGSERAEAIAAVDRGASGRGRSQVHVVIVQPGQERAAVAVDLVLGGDRGQPRADLRDETAGDSNVAPGTVDLDVAQDGPPGG